MAKPIIDVSEHNGILNWDLMKDQIDGAIIRCGYGGDIASQDDKQYERNVSECTRLQIPYGVYLFSYAVNAQEARGEADHVLRLVRGKKLTLPIYYDLEHTDYVGDLSAALYTQIANAFCERIEAAGGFVGIYANLYYWQTKLMNVNDYSRWLAQWSDAPTLEQPFDLWQYTSSGVIAGSSARSDLNKWYGDFMTMAKDHNDFSGDEPVITPPDQMKYKVGDRVQFSALYTSSTATTPITEIAVHEGVITKVLPNARNPYLINDGTGWVNNAIIQTGSTTPPQQGYKVGDTLHFHALYTSSTAAQPITNIAVTQGTITKIINGAPNPYLINNGTGWVNASVIDSVTASPLKVGDQVKVKAGARDYNGTALAPFVYQGIYTVMEINADRVVIGKNKQVTAALKASDLQRVS